MRSFGACNDVSADATPTYFFITHFWRAGNQTVEGNENYNMSDHDFHSRVFTTSILSMLFFTGLVGATYLDIQTCPYAAGGANAAAASVFAPEFRVFPCHMVDLLVWVYIACLCIFMRIKWVEYRALSYHWFMADWCYFHNLLLTALLLLTVVHVAPHGDPSVAFGLSKQGDGVVLGFGYRLDVRPIGAAVSRLMDPATRRAFVFVFFGLLGSSAGPILWAIAVWKNALLFHADDKMTSCYLHLAPATVQCMMLHAAFVSVGAAAAAAGGDAASSSAAASATVASVSRALLSESTTLSFIFRTHAVMFAVWQVVYHVANETRSWQRKRTAARLLSSPHSNNADTGVLTQRVTAYTWMLEHPIGGKGGALHRLLFALGPQEVRTKFMFSVIQFGLHVAFLLVGYVPIRASVALWSAEPLLLYTLCFLVLAIRNAAIVMKRWIQKLQAEAAAAAAGAGTGTARPATPVSPAQQAKKQS